MENTEKILIEPIAEIENDFTDKFGIPRQSGLIENITSRIIFKSPYRSKDAIRGLEGFSHLWLIWHFSKAERKGNPITVRPPRLGGNERMGVFATRSPFRPNPLGLSCVKIEEIRYTKRGPEIIVSGADLLNGTPIFDIKPYLPFADSKPNAKGGFADERKDYALRVEIPEDLKEKIPKEKLNIIEGILAEDPRPSYTHNEDRIYGFSFGKTEIKFKVKEGILTVEEIIPQS